MDWPSNRLFGRIIATKYEKPVWGFLEWTIIPDMKYFKDSAWRHTILHRTSLHGIGNIDAVIEHGKAFPQYVNYVPSEDDYIRCLIMSHNWLDLFNFIIHPSWPKNWHFVFIRENLRNIFMGRTIQAPKELAVVLEKMVKEHKNAWDLYHTMLIEYLNLPDVGWYMRQVLNLYKR